ATLPVQIDHDEPGIGRLADGDVRDFCDVGGDHQLLLEPTWSKIDVVLFHTTFRDLVALAYVAGCLIVHCDVTAAIRHCKRAWIGEQRILEGCKHLRLCRRLEHEDAENRIEEKAKTLDQGHVGHEC